LDKNRFQNMKTHFKLTLVFIIVSIVISCKKDKSDNNDNNDNPSTITVTDIDGNVYHTVTIGTQVWLVENLKTTKYRYGNSIPNVIDSSQWTTLTTGAYCDYNNDASNSSIYGRLYNWFAVNDSQNIAPLGWHVASDKEWKIMEKFLDSTVDTTVIVGTLGTDIGGKLKETGIEHWTSPNTGATNISGFTALPGGNRSTNGTYYNIHDYGLFWCTTAFDSTKACFHYFVYTNSNGVRYIDNKANGFSVRCIKD
jgi:uncharacterized protein (TIGR02145 family)